jgi:hypothetical protein
MAGRAMNRRLLFLSATAAILAAYLIAEGWLGRHSGQPSDGTAGQAGSTAETGRAPAEPARLNPLEGLDGQSLTAMTDRPLFNPGRAPRPAEPPPPPPPDPVEPPPADPQPAAVGPAEQDFTLLAVAAGPAGRVAALRIAATGEVLYLREGQPVTTWTLLSVEEKSVVIGTREASVTLKLFETDASAPVPPPEAPAAEQAAPMEPPSEPPSGQQ